MRNTEGWKILQIIPAENWLAHTPTDSLELVCWALVEMPDGERIVTGIDCYMSFVEGLKGSSHYERGPA